VIFLIHVHTILHSSLAPRQANPTTSRKHLGLEDLNDNKQTVRVKNKEV